MERHFYKTQGAARDLEGPGVGPWSQGPCCACATMRAALFFCVPLQNTHLRDRCYDFLNILPKKLAKNGVFLLKTKLNYAKLDHNIGFLKKRQFFRQKMAENCNQNIDPVNSLKLYALFQKSLPYLGQKIFPRYVLRKSTRTSPASSSTTTTPSYAWAPSSTSSRAGTRKSDSSTIWLPSM
jgi:hypothetical protein